MNKHVRAADLRPRSYDPATNTIDVIWTTGASVRRRDYRRDVIYDEVLSLEPGHVRLDRLNSGAPLLDAHDDRRLAAVIGSVVPGSARIENGVGVARVKLSSADADAGVIGKIRDGIIRSISVGYAIHSFRTEAGQNGTDETRVITDWEPLELSAVPVPADAGAHFRSHHDDSPEAARARMLARQEAVTPPKLRRASVEEVTAMGRISWHIPDELWPLVEDDA